jgi:hypothetical protein
MVVASVPISKVPAGTQTWAIPAGSIRVWPGLDPGSDDATGSALGLGLGLGLGEAAAEAAACEAGTGEARPWEAGAEAVEAPAQPARRIARSDAARLRDRRAG